MVHTEIPGYVAGEFLTPQGQTAAAPRSMACAIITAPSDRYAVL